MEKRETVHIATCKVEGPKQDRNGKDFYSVGIKTNEHGDKWFNCHYFPFNPDRWEGTEQSLIFYEEDYNGKTYSKFKLPPKNGFGGMSDTDRVQLNRAVETANAAMTAVKKLRGDLQLAGVLPTVASGGETADFGEVSSFSGQKDPEEESLEASAEAAMR